ARTDMAWVGDNVAGPVGILGVLFPSVVGSGLEQIVLLSAIISLTLAVMNILPIPSLDGGRWFVMVLFRLFKKPLTKEREENIQVVGFLILMILIVMVTWNDITKFF
ncbi:MAG: site-2 protease family protein, partial [Rickettsia endosymbiont of Ixodes persulcatus]|nr:site-2 protease family protein [Rickettsia endosymbiont of Ixodes persulcatus]